MGFERYAAMPWPSFENKAFIGVNHLRTRAARGGTRVCYAKLPFRPRGRLAGFHLPRNQIPDPPRATYPARPFMQRGTTPRFCGRIATSVDWHAGLDGFSEDG